MATGAATPEKITHAFSLSGGHLAWAIATGKKRIENRHVRFRPGWYGFGVTLTAHTGVMDDKWFRDKYTISHYPGFNAFGNMRGKIIGACYVSHSLPHEQCKDDDYACSSYPIKNIISKVIPFVSGIPARGNFGTWPLAIEARDEVRLAVGRLLAGGDDVILDTDAEKDFPPDPAWNGKTKAVFEGPGEAPKPPRKNKAKVSSKPTAKPQASAISKPKKPKLVSLKPAFDPTLTLAKKEIKITPLAPKPIEDRTDIRSFFGGK